MQATKSGMIHIEALKSDSHKLASPMGVVSKSSSDENKQFKTIDQREIEENIETQRVSPSTMQCNNKTLNSQNVGVDSDNFKMKLN